MSSVIDIDHLRRWIGAEETVSDIVTVSLIERFQATLGSAEPAPREGDLAPRLIHFCLCQPAAGMDMLGDDGHLARGGFLPPVPLPRRMWAGSVLRFSGDIRAGDTVVRRSHIADVAVKQGRSGNLCFVAVDHRIEASGQLVVEDRQTIVYREAPKKPASSAPGEPAPAGQVSHPVTPTPTLLFRYSALTFNGHRIHYDQPYATGVEGYPGLVVHGPLQATMLYRFAVRERGGVPPTAFEFRNLSTLFDGDAFALHAASAEDGSMRLWTARDGGPVAMQAEARWA